jgi:hypothetical protein
VLPHEPQFVLDQWVFDYLNRHSILLPVEDSFDYDVVPNVAWREKTIRHNLARIHLEHAI